MNGVGLSRNQSGGRERGQLGAEHGRIPEHRERVAGASWAKRRCNQRECKATKPKATGNRPRRPRKPQVGAFNSGGNANSRFGIRTSSIWGGIQYVNWNPRKG